MSSTSVTRMGFALARNCNRISSTCSVLVHGHFCLLAKLARRDRSSEIVDKHGARDIIRLDALARGHMVNINSCTRSKDLQHLKDWYEFANRDRHALLIILCAIGHVMLWNDSFDLTFVPDTLVSFFQRRTFPCRAVRSAFKVSSGTCILHS